MTNSVNLKKAAAQCACLPGAAADVKWGTNLTYCVGGKMFAVFLTKDGKTPASAPSFKVDDDLFLAFTGRPGVVPAPYLARHKWVMLQTASRMSDGELAQCLARSYELVRAKLPKKLQKELLKEQPQ
jgi:predicted DNA-binding protein (MmcQ/YjbR family)